MPIHVQLGQLDAGIADLSSAIKLEQVPKIKFDLIRFRGRLYDQNKQYDLAAADFIQFMKLRPDEKTVYLELAKSHFKGKRNQEALADCNDVIKRNSRDAGAYALRAQIYARLNQKSLSEADQRTARDCGHDLESEY